MRNDVLCCQRFCIYPLLCVERLMWVGHNASFPSHISNPSPCCSFPTHFLQIQNTTSLSPLLLVVGLILTLALPWEDSSLDSIYTGCVNIELSFFLFLVNILFLSCYMLVHVFSTSQWLLTFKCSAQTPSSLKSLNWQNFMFYWAYLASSPYLCHDEQKW